MIDGTDAAWISEPGEQNVKATVNLNSICTVDRIMIVFTLRPLKFEVSVISVSGKAETQYKKISK